MIPRTKVNYYLSDLLQAFFISESGKDYKKYLVSLLRNYLQEENILLTPSGRAGLYFILKAIDSPRILIPAYTCKAVAEAAILAGKEVTCVEVEEDGFNMSISALEAALDDGDIVIATHQFGIPCQIEKILELCAQKQAFVIEDVAASLGSRVRGKLTGTFGDAAFYSFDSTKLVNVPMKGGFLHVKNPALFERIQRIYAEEICAMPAQEKIKLLAKGGVLWLLENPWLYKLFHTLFFEARGKFTEDTPVLNQKKTEFYRYDLANWQACIAAVQVAKIEEIIQVRQYQYAEYMTKLADCLAFKLPPEDEAAEWACIRFPIRVRGDKISYYQRAVKRGLVFAAIVNSEFDNLHCPPRG